MRRALEQVGEHASGTEPLSLDVLASAHAVALGHDAPSRVRTTPAFAKQGDERYGLLGREWEAGLEPQLECARLYLDVCFFHPFADGNARAARLAVAWLDMRHRIGFANLLPVFSVSRSAGDASTYWDFVRSLLTSEAARSERRPSGA